MRIPEFIIENLITGEFEFPPNYDDSPYCWEDTWQYMKHVCCHGGNPEGNCILHETTPYDPSSFPYKYAPGYKQRPEVRRKIVAMIKAARNK